MLLLVRRGMSEVNWLTLLERQDRHLVVVSLPQQGTATGFRGIDGRSKRQMLRRLLGKLSLVGSYAVTIERGRGVTEIMCGFYHQRDAAEAAKALGGTEVAPYEGWRTQREVALDDAKEEGLLEMAGRPRLRQRRTDEQFEPMVRPAFRPRARIARE